MQCKRSSVRRTVIIPSVFCLIGFSYLHTRTVTIENKVHSYGFRIKKERRRRCRSHHAYLVRMHGSNQSKVTCNLCQTEAAGTSCTGVIRGLRSKLKSPHGGRQGIGVGSREGLTDGDELGPAMSSIMFLVNSTAAYTAWWILQEDPQAESITVQTSQEENTIKQSSGGLVGFEVLGVLGDWSL